MLAIFGANGRTGFEVVKEALKRNMPIKAIARNDHDTHRLEGILSVNEISFADADHVESIKMVLQDVTAVLCCIDSRTAGFGSPIYTPEAAANIVQTASEMGIEKILHLSVMGAYRWSPNPLNKQSFHLDIHVRRLRTPWTMLRVSCYHDELIEGHVHPPDGGRPHSIHPSSRYSPVSRRDTARVVCNILPDLIPNRTWLIGGPKVYQGLELQKTVAPYIVSGAGKTNYGPLPHGDFSVAPETSEVMVGWIPTESLEWAMDPKNNPVKKNTEPFWNRTVEKRHHSDQAQEDLLCSVDEQLRFVVHKGLYDDLLRINIIEKEDISFDFSEARWNEDSKEELIYQSSFQAIQNIGINHSNTIIKRANCNFIYDELADAFFIWWENEEDLPLDIWNKLDLGIKRRLSKHPQWKHSSQLRDFLATSHERVTL